MSDHPTKPSNTPIKLLVIFGVPALVAGVLTGPEWVNILDGFPPNFIPMYLVVLAIMVLFMGFAKWREKQLIKHFQREREQRRQERQNRNNQNK